MNSKMFQIRIAVYHEVHADIFYFLKTVLLANLKDALPSPPPPKCFTDNFQALLLLFIIIKSFF